MGDRFVFQWWNEARLVILASIVASIAVGILTYQFLSTPAIITLLVSGVLGGLLYFVVLGYLKNWRKLHSGFNTN
jgi:ABC-type uncharacterized transport system permease subunit